MKHALRMARYNAPLYAFIAVATVGGVGLVVAPLPLGIRLGGAALALGASWFGVASFGAFFWLFDHSGFLSGEFVREIVEHPRRWVQLSVFLEETTLPLDAVYPDAEGRELDLFSPTAMTEPAVNRARGNRESLQPIACSPDALAIQDDWAEVTVVTLVAHELRDPELRKGLFAELARVTGPDGRVVLVEHTRNLWALLAYGPGWWHFMAASEWRIRSVEAGLSVVEERFVTPFVQVFVLAHSPTS